MKSKEILQDENRKLTFLEKCVSASGGMTGTFFFQMIQMYLLFFYTDIFKVSPLYVAGLFLVVRIIDAFVTPLFGILVDRVTTPWGKYRPWFLIIGIPTAVFGFLTFTTVDLSSTGKIVYVTITYLVFSVCMAIAQAPGAAMTPAMTKRLDDRISLGTFNYIFVMIGAMFVSIGALPLINALGSGNQAKGFSMLMGSVGIVAILLNFAQFAILKERFVIPRDKDAKYSLKQIADSVLKNKTAIIGLVFIFILNLSNGLKSAIMIHYFKYFFHNEGLMVTMGIVGLIPTMLGVMLSGVITKKIGVRNNLVVGSLISIVTTVLVLFIPSTPNGMTVFIALSVIGALFGGITMPAQGTLMPAAMDYAEWKTGINSNAFMGSLQGFMQTFATAISGAIAAGALSIIGYVPNAEQSSTTLFGLKVLMSILPAVIYAFTLIVWKFDLTEEKQHQIAHELAERRKAAQVQA
ncbi:MFS transporter [Clostridium fungisolvens]|uniref:Isoprimeverose transporter n=1 Tax=Clostridium fungisolvens TaxID=1604897 RepID=A0A6V8SII6_9CLOT|nr:glycoside-pentoside-hexuronide (GPH):cation symporter [Clostridium fungisolvens]GFP74683.1 Isoprimeverose transporter [Clostridium fungisolvens]